MPEIMDASKLTLITTYCDDDGVLTYNSGDNPGTDTTSRRQACYEACMGMAGPLDTSQNGFWSRYTPSEVTHFMVNSVGVCYCQKNDPFKCTTAVPSSYTAYAMIEDTSLSSYCPEDYSNTAVRPYNGADNLGKDVKSKKENCLYACLNLKGDLSAADDQYHNADFWKNYPTNQITHYIVQDDGRCYCYSGNVDDCENPSSSDYESARVGSYQKNFPSGCVHMKIRNEDSDTLLHHADNSNMEECSLANKCMCVDHDNYEPQSWNDQKPFYEDDGKLACMEACTQGSEPVGEQDDLYNNLNFFEEGRIAKYFAYNAGTGRCMCYDYVPNEEAPPECTAKSITKAEIYGTQGYDFVQLGECDSSYGQNTYGSLTRDDCATSTKGYVWSFIHNTGSQISGVAGCYGEDALRSCTRDSDTWVSYSFNKHGMTAKHWYFFELNDDSAYLVRHDDAYLNFDLAPLYQSKEVQRGASIDLDRIIGNYSYYEISFDKPVAYDELTDKCSDSVEHQN